MNHAESMRERIARVIDYMYSNEIEVHQDKTSSQSFFQSSGVLFNDTSKILGP